MSKRRTGRNMKCACGKSMFNGYRTAQHAIQRLEKANGRVYFCKLSGTYHVTGSDDRVAYERLRSLTFADLDTSEEPVTPARTIPMDIRPKERKCS